METRPQEPLPERPDTQWVSLWLDGELTPEQEQRLQRALQQDAQLAQVAQQWKQLRSQLQGLPRRELGAEFTQGVLDRIAALETSADSSPQEEGQTTAPATVPEEDSACVQPPAASLQSRRRLPWEFWACVGTAVATASLLLFWVWQPWQPRRPVVMDYAETPQPGASALKSGASPEGAPFSPAVLDEAEIRTERSAAEKDRMLPRNAPSAHRKAVQENKRNVSKSPSLAKEKASKGRAAPTRAGAPRRAPGSPAAKLAPGGAGYAASLKARRRQGGDAPRPQTIPWHQLPRPLQATLAVAQQTRPVSQVVVVQLGVTREALRRGWLRAQLASVSPEQRERQRRTSERFRRSAPAEKAGGANPKADAASQDKADATFQNHDTKNAERDKPARQTVGKMDQVVRLRVSPEKFPQLLDRLARAQAAGGPVQYLNVGQLADAIPALEADQFGFPNKGGAGGFAGGAASPPPKQQIPVSQQLVLHPLPQTRLFSQQKAVSATRQLQRAADGRSRPAAALQGAAQEESGSPQQPVVQLWLVVELQPSGRSSLPLVAPAPSESAQPR